MKNIAQRLLNITTHTACAPVMIFPPSLLLCSFNLTLARFMQVLEVGQVGKAGAARGQNFSFYAHSQRNAPFGDAASLVKALQQAAKHAAEHASHLNVSNSLYRAALH